MKKLALIAVCVLGLVFAGSAARPTPDKKDPVKKEVVKKDAVKKETDKDKKVEKKIGLKVEKKEEPKKK